ncbi:hypothetical protein DFJ74DRAFT_663011 [Hyaloraphidium curvatum]|nr:hypothetical protein DFJ74DRAFT_663011 [Hyaloraphidium curvatum]
MVLFASLGRTYRQVATAKGHSAQRPPEPDYAAHPLAVLVRWSQLVELDSAGADREPRGDVSPLLRHDEADPLCPCAAGTCAGSLVRSVPVLSLLEVSCRLLAVTTPNVLALSSPMIISAGPFWTSWWAVPGMLALLGLADYVPVNVVGRFPTNASLLRLSLRIQRRAMLLSLRSLLASFNHALSSAAEPPDDDLYARLHYRLADAWERRVPHMSGGVLLGFAAGMFLVSLVSNLAAGSCVPAYAAAGFAYILLMASTDLAHAALSNEQIERITDLYRGAQTEIRDMLVRAERHPPSPALSRVERALRRHDALLSSFREVAVFRGRFLGFVADFGVLRTFLVTVFTLAVGLWSVARGSVFFTLDSICPAR